MKNKRHSGLAVLLLGAASMSGCGGGSSYTPPPPPPASYTVGGHISGLQGTGLVLLDNGGSNLSVAANSTTFTFAASVTSGNPYDVTVMTQPASPTQTCTVANASGVVGGSNVTDVMVTCNNASEQLIISDMQGNSAAFFIDPGTGSLGSSGIPTGLTGTGQIGTDPAGKFLFVLNSTPPSISAYTVDPLTGALVQVAGSPFTAPVNPDGVAVDPSGKFLYSGSASGALAYTINGVTGALSLVPGSPFAAPLVGLNPGAVMCQCVATTSFLYYSQWLGVGAFDINSFAIDTTTGALTSIGSAGPNTCCTDDIRATTDVAGKFFFLIADRTVQTYAVNSSTGALTNPAITSAPPPTLWVGITVDPSGSFAYVLDSDYTPSLYAFSVDPVSGALTPLSPATIPSGGSPQQIRFDLTGKFLYVTTAHPTAVWAYSFNSTTGALTPVAGSPFMTAFSPNAMVVTSLH